MSNSIAKEVYLVHDEEQDLFEELGKAWEEGNRFIVRSLNEPEWGFVTKEEPPKELELDSAENQSELKRLFEEAGYEVNAN